jgi:hypothetical protein
MFELTFGTTEDSQKPIDTLTEVLTQVRSVRELTKVTVEDGGSDGQRAHTTSNIVFVAAVERLFFDKTWLLAWQQLRDLWDFEGKLLTAWCAQPALDAGAQKWLKQQLAGVVSAAKSHIDTHRVARGGVSLASAWFVEPLTGTQLERHDGRIYFDHRPNSTEYDTTQFALPRRWRPNLSGGYVSELSQALEAWVAARGRFPWTSVDADSFVTGDEKAVRQTEEAIGAVVGATPTSKEAKNIADAMMGTFDFFPASLTAKRTLHHAAGVAARHVVEHCRFHPDIKPSWRQPIANAFLDSWGETIEDDATTQESKGTTGKRKRDEPRDTTALRELQKRWSDVSTAYHNYYTAFAAALS